MFAGSAGVAAVIFLLDAKERSPPDGAGDRSSASSAEGEAESPLEAAPSHRPIETSAEDAARSAPLPARELPRPATRPEGDAPCFSDMVLVEGEHCPFVAHTCEKKRDRKPGEEPICDRYKNEVLCEGGLIPLRFCIDRYEYPNRSGVLPAVLASFDEAERLCAIEDKRLCTVREWTFACEGERVVPYANGLVRDGRACNVDAGPEGRVVPTRGPTVEAALGAIDKRRPAGGAPECASPFGVFDLTGNVAEWAFEPLHGRTTSPFASVIVGGGWGKSPSTCRSADDAHPSSHRAASLGFRCCTDAFTPSKRVPVAGRRGGGLRPVFAASAGPSPVGPPRP